MGSHRSGSRRSESHLPIRPALAAALTLALGIAAMLLAAPASASAGTYVRLAQLTEDMAGSDLVLSSVSDPQRSVTIPGIGYGALSEYRLIEPGDYVVGLTPEGSSGSPTVNLTLNAMAGESYTLAAVTKAANQTGLSVLTDDLTPPEPGNAKLRIIGAAPSAPTLDVRGPGGDLALGLTYAGASGYRNLPAGATTLQVGPPGGSAVQLPITLAPNQVASVVLVDRDGALAADLRVDAEGPTQIPPGAIKAGFGGAAGESDGSAGVIVFSALALAAAGLARVLARRTRSARPRP
ncbi:MAG TPA: DUF4397 domain-containing protein [Pseudonocardia sp.]|nr:DUF4397 domain-containing protein [Pseudonocardia sp.]